MLAVMRERLVVERLEDDVDLLFEELAVGRLIEQRRAEGFDLAGVIAPPDAEDDPAAGQDVGGGIILDEAQRVPHRGDVEAAAELDVPGQVCQVQRRHQDIGDALVAFVLEMMLGHPEGVVAQPIHQLRHRLGLVEDRRQLFVGKPAVVHRGAGIAGILHVDVPGKQTVEFGNHGMASGAESPIDP